MARIIRVHVLAFLLSVLPARIGWLTFSAPVIRWAQTWSINQSRIITLTMVNTAITTSSEIVSRTIVPQITNDHTEGFFVQTNTGSTRIHNQSIINILMTLFASLLGGPVYFMKKRKHRFLFFMSFGVCNSLLAQSISSLALHGLLTIATTRLLFDLFYNSTIKFFLFEYVRPIILKLEKRFIQIAAVRVTQDFLTTFCRVLVLMSLNLKG